ncbi:MAG TPA: histidinol-phosphatase HisJ family protein [Candidatus Acetatifactor stercoripullorum]|uniref:Histidinol-phosphatase n=1 Tax=Candidatus Acetatifactor stercoripullorum TaxID=2838414 RepID=A0A9D1R765_9FIRM|nr:histidinol-phosphatase HisJ family protein [uncultured Acetatifactor sp.]HIW82519.1 histidinol-phosphatase HisJ family protein [Candidatus Acetatifactor stercoripullorum]
MPITSDFHLHSSFSGDSSTPMEEMILKGISLGLTEICFTEHNDFAYPAFPGGDGSQFLLNTDAYLYDLIRYREKYADKIKVLFGVELGLQPQLMRQDAVYAKSYDFDFIIGSSHLCHGRDPYFPSFFEGRTQEEAYLEYFESILENIKKHSNFDVYGHLDYVVRYGPNKDQGYSYAGYREVLDQILEALIEGGKGLEVNTGGLKRGLSDLHPCTDILKRYRQLGGEIVTVGSDAHNAQSMAADFDRAGKVLLDCGFRYYTIFEKRTPEFRRI